MGALYPLQNAECEKIPRKLLKFHKQAADEQHVVRFLSSSSDEKTATLSNQFRMARDITRKDRTVGDKSEAGSKKPSWKTKLQSRPWDLGPRADPMETFPLDAARVGTQ